jgi:hypothetical protein
MHREVLLYIFHFTHSIRAHYAVSVPDSVLGKEIGYVFAMRACDGMIALHTARGARVALSKIYGSGRQSALTTRHRPSINLCGTTNNHMYLLYSTATYPLCII